MQELQQKLEGVFAHIHAQRMRDIPVCNPALQVQAVGFHEWEDYYLGVMLTPWFMNLMLLPQDPQTLAAAAIGSKQMQVFPSGHYEFVLSEEEALGRFLVCSLFSPLFEFQDQATAVEVATISLEELMDEDNLDTNTSRDSEIRRIWQGEQDVEAAEDGQEEKVPPAPAAPMSRRDFLRGTRKGQHNEGQDVGD